MKTLFDAITDLPGNIEDVQPEYLCWMCEKHYTFINGDMCSWCIDEQAHIEKKLLEGE